MQRPLDARAVVLPKVPDALRHQLEVLRGDVAAPDLHFAVEETSGGDAAEVEDDFEEPADIGLSAERHGHPRRQHREQLFELAGIRVLPDVRGRGSHAPTAISPG